MVPGLFPYALLAVVAGLTLAGAALAASPGLAARGANASYWLRKPGTRFGPTAPRVLALRLAGAAVAGFGVHVAATLVGLLGGGA